MRPAVPGDAAAIADIWNHAIRETTVTFTTDEKDAAQIEALIASQPFFVITTDPAAETPVAFATYGRFRSGPGYAGVAEHSIYIRASETGAGLGRKLLTHMMEFAAQNGVRVLVAGMGGENDASVQFHAAMGFTKVAQMPDIGTKFGRHHDLIFMQKMLDVPH